MITITTAAKKKLLELWQSKKGSSPGLLIGIGGRNPNGFEYVLRFLDDEDVVKTQKALDVEDMPILIDAESVDSLKGSTVDFTAIGGGFRIDNPNPVWSWSDPVSQAIQDVLTNQINPQIAAHGGFVRLIEVKESIAYIEMGGGCVGCGLVDVTLKQGVEVAIKAAVPEITQVLDTTDHSQGTNPYYQETKGSSGPHHQPSKGNTAHHQPSKGGPPPSSPFSG